MNKLAKLINTIQLWHKSGKEAAMATLIHSSGTSPLPVGEMMAISSCFDMQGAVSRGCVESAVLETAQDAIKNNRTLLQHYGFSDQNAWQVGLTCGGEIDVLIEPLLQSRNTTEFFECALAQLKAEEPSCLLHFLDEEHFGKKIIYDHEKIQYSDLPASLVITPDGLHALEELDGSRVMDLPLPNGKKLPVFVNYLQPAHRLIIVGAAEIAIYLAKMAKLLEFNVIIIDPRSMFATQVRFPDADTILAKWPQDCLPALNLKVQDALVVISHDEKIDLPALQIGLESHVSYIGLLGSLITRQNRFDALRETGWQETDLARLHAPIGLDIGSKKADEIALSILSEIIQEKNKPRSV
ncbi:MAG: XdhC family protein [Anaerolineaceae bacterium]